MGSSGIDREKKVWLGGKESRHKREGQGRGQKQLNETRLKAEGGGREEERLEMRDEGGKVGDKR